MMGRFRARGLWLSLWLAATALLLNASWAQGALVVGLRAQSCDPALLASARDRVQQLFAQVRSRPLFACLEQPLLGVAVPYGQTRFAPGLPAVVLLGPNGQNIDVAAHEWAHAELSARTGVLVRSWRLPTWLDEGIAMQLDHRPEYGAIALTELLSVRPVPQLAAMTNSAGFFTGERDLARLRYGFARCVVGRWLVADGRSQLTSWLAQQSLWRAIPAAQWQAQARQCGLHDDA